jgi:hypothetical protein
MCGQADLSVMVNASLPDRPSGLHSRVIATSDLDAVVELLNRGFGYRRSRRFWRRVVATLSRHSAPDGFPQYGYLLESAGRPVGVLLLIFSVPATANPGAVRCNMSSWYVEPEFRSYAVLLSAKAMRYKSVTYLNISPAPHTLAIIKAQKYVPYSRGVFFAAPVLAGRGSDVHVVRGDVEPDAPHEAFESELLRRHSGYGCVSFWCETAERAYPFVFRRRFVKAVLPCAQLIYCRDIADVVQFSAVIGRRLMAHGCPLIVTDANDAVPGLMGKYVEGLMPKYYRGVDPPRLGDLAYTEAALFGV